MATSQPLSIPVRIKIKGLKALTATVTAIATQMEKIMTNVAALNARLDNIAADITGLKAAGVAKAAADAATIQTLRDELAAALAGSSASTQAAVKAAVDTAQASFEASLVPLVTKAAAIDEETPPVVTAAV